MQVSTALSVALIGGIFYTLLGTHDGSATITQAFVVAILCVACCLATGAGLGLTLVRPSDTASTQRRGSPAHGDKREAASAMPRS